MSQQPLPPARHQRHLLIPSAPNNQPAKNKESGNEIQLSTNLIVLPWPTYTELRAKRGRLEPSPKRGSGKIDLQKQGRNTQKKASHIVQPGVTYRSQHLEVDLEPSAKRGTSRSRALVSLY